MIDPRNSVNLAGGITRLEFPTDNIMKFGLAIDFAGSEKGSDNTSGYFDVVYYMNNEATASTTKFIRGQIDAGNFKVGSQVHIVGRLVHERWQTAESKGQKVVVVAEAISYYGSKNRSDEGSGTKPAQAELPSDW